MSRIKRRRETSRTVPAAAPSTGVVAAERVDAEPTEPGYSAEPSQSGADRWAVFQNPGPGTYRGKLAIGSRGVLPVGCEVSLPPEDHADAVAEGLEFVRWARGAA